MSTRRRSKTDPENPEWTAEEFATAVPVANDAEGTGHLIAAIVESARRQRRGRGAQKRPTKARVTVRLEREALALYRATGRGWQSRLSADISTAAKRRARQRSA